MNHLQRTIHVWFTLASTVLCIVVQSVAGAVIPGHVEAWGRNLFGETVPPAGLEGVIAVAGGTTHSLALRSDGTVVAWGSDNNGQSPVSVPAGLSNVVAIAARSVSAAVKADGTVVVWGPRPELTNVPPQAVGVTAVEIVANAVIALRADGTVIAWGLGGETNVPPGLSNVVQISGVNAHVLALTRDGSIVGWGLNSSGEASHPPGLTNVVKVGAGQSVSMALRADGTLFWWGSEFDYALPRDLPGLTGVVDFDIGNQHAIALRTNGTVVAWGANFAGQGSVPPMLSGVTAISAGGNHNLVITARPVIRSITPPISTTAGSTVTFTVNASGQRLRYQWQHKGTNLPTGTTASLVIPNVQPSDAGTYTVYVSNPFGSNFAETSVSLPPPVITTQPESRSVIRGEKVLLTVGASGFPPFTYQWFRNANPMPTETNATLMVPTMGREDSSVYRVTISDSAGGNVTSSNANVTVLDPRPVAVTLRPVMDTSIFSAGTNPLGTATILSGTRENGIRDRGLLRFDFSAIPTNAFVESAILRLHLFRAPRRGANSTFRLHRALKPWGPDATWANSSNTQTWSAPGGKGDIDYSTNNSPRHRTEDGFYVFGSTNELVADVSEWIRNPHANNGWFLIVDEEATPGTARHFGSSESEYPPELSIRYAVPAEIPTFREIHRESSNFVFTVNGEPGWFYHFQTREALDRGDWTALTNVPAGAGSMPIMISIPLTNSHQFFRALRN